MTTMENLLKNKVGLVILLMVPILFFGIAFMTEDFELGAQVAGGTLLAGLSITLVTRLCKRYVSWDVTPTRYVFIFTASIAVIVILFFGAQLVVDTGSSLLESLKEKLSFEG
jgi:ABC-type transport system involved in multi-copper enzyme maturation permease subunit